MPGDDAEIQDQSQQRTVWEQQDGESNLHYSWFHTYLLLGSARSLTGAYNTFRANIPGKSGKVWTNKPDASPSWKRAAEKWNWKTRVTAWDARQREELEAQKKRERLEKEKELEERMFRLRERGIEKVERMFDVPIVAVETVSADGKRITVNPAKWDFNTAVRLLQTLDKMGTDETTVTVKSRNGRNASANPEEEDTDDADDGLTEPQRLERVLVLLERGRARRADASRSNAGKGAPDVDAVSEQSAGDGAAQ